MIQSRVEARDVADWKTALRQGVRDLRELLDRLGLEPEALLDPADPRSEFPLRVPLAFVARMRRGDPHDPLLRQVLATMAERDDPDGALDVVGDGAAMALPGVLRKYAGRALLIATGSCAIHCRYCFRRHFDYAEGQLSATRLDAALAALHADRSISEVILSGGDPLVLDTPKLERLTERLASIAHLRRLRIHTRLPIVLPERVDAALARWLRALPWPSVMVVHANHPRELDAAVATALRTVAASGVTVLNQAVLLAGVNDRLEVLTELSERLFEVGVLPYYLHQLDRVRGTGRFAVPDAQARTLHAGLRACLPGYLVPRLVREVAGAPSKLPLL